MKATLGEPAQSQLKAARLNAGLSLKAVAEVLGVSPQAIHQFEKSEAAGTISLRQLENVARAIGCRLTYLIASPRRSTRTVRVESPPQKRRRQGGEPVSAVLDSSPEATSPVSLERFTITSD